MNACISDAIIMTSTFSVPHTVDELSTPQPPSISVSISASGSNTAGQTYRLVCSATVTGSTDQPTFTWLDPINNTVPSGIVNTTGSMSTLTFSPLAVSHAGNYTCRVTAGGVTETQTTTVILNNTGIPFYIPKITLALLTQCNNNYYYTLIIITKRCMTLLPV